MSTTSRNKPDWLDYKNPAYAEIDALATTCWDMYNGGINVSAEKYLIKHNSESAEHYAGRKKIAYFDNHLKSVINTLFNFMFSKDQNIMRLSGDKYKADYLELLEKDIDGAGNNIDVFMRNTGIRAAVETITFIYIEPNKNAAPFSVDSLDYTTLPKWRLIPRKNVLDWLVQDNEIKMVKMYSEYDGRTSLQDKEKFIKSREYLVWEKSETGGTRWTKYNDDGMIIEQQELPELKDIPIVPVKFASRSYMQGVGLLEDSAPIQFALFNLDNKIYDFIQASTTVQICFSYMRDEQKKEIQNMNRGNQYFWCFPNDVRLPTVLQFDTAPLQNCLSLRSELVQAIYQMLKQRLIETTDNASLMSGESKKQDFNVTNSEIASLALCLEDAENYAHYHTAAWIFGSDKAEDNQSQAIYPREFNTNDLNNLFAEYEKMKMNNFNRLILSEYEKQIIKGTDTFKNLDAGRQAELLDSIEAETEPEIKPIDFGGFEIEKPEINNNDKKEVIYNDN